VPDPGPGLKLTRDGKLSCGLDGRRMAMEGLAAVGADGGGCANCWSFRRTEAVPLVEMIHLRSAAGCKLCTTTSLAVWDQTTMTLSPYVMV
jgi:hypothetical protein